MKKKKIYTRENLVFVRIVLLHLSNHKELLRWLSHRFLFQTPLKTRVEPQKQHWSWSAKKVVLKIFASFTGKHLCWNLFKNLFRPATLLKRDSNTDVFLRNLQNLEERLIWSMLTTGSETCSFTWTAPFNNLHFWLKLVHML